MRSHRLAGSGRGHKEFVLIVKNELKRKKMLFLVLLILCCLVEVVPGTLLSVCLGIVMYL